MHGLIMKLAILCLTCLTAPILSQTTQDPLLVDLSYAKYLGTHNATTHLNSWLGIRYAAPPTGSRRWQAPQPPEPQRSEDILDADAFGPSCPQAMPSFPNQARTFVPGNEDCLFLNVYAPDDAGGSLLPVFVMIHGGGYGLGDGRTDLSGFMKENGNGFVAVVVQYRVSLTNDERRTKEERILKVCVSDKSAF